MMMILSLVKNIGIFRNARAPESLGMCNASSRRRRDSNGSRRLSEASPPDIWTKKRSTPKVSQPGACRVFRHPSEVQHFVKSPTARFTTAQGNAPDKRIIVNTALKGRYSDRIFQQYCDRNFASLARLASFANLCLIALLACMASPAGADDTAPRQGDLPNVLFIIIDDHPANMVSVLDESIVQTPNMERLAERGTWFTRAYNAAPVCAASRAAFLTGVHPSNSGVYYNAQGWRRTNSPIAQATSLPGHFLRNGYLTAGYGKIDHTPYQFDEPDDFTPGYRIGHRDRRYNFHSDADLAEFAIPETLRTPDPDYLASQFGALPDDWDRDDPEKMQEDTLHANSTIAFLQQEHDRPFFVTCGFWRPHTRRIVPKRYFDMYPLDEIEIPVGYKAGDLEDVPAPGRWRATKRGTHAALVNAGLWKEALQSYYAATTYVDEQIGRVLDALEASPYADNTIVIFAGDNGYHGGEKDLWSKFALWDQTNRVAFAISVPGFPAQAVHTPVGLIDIYPTLLALCGLAAPEEQVLDGVDLVPILKGETDDRGAPVLSTYGEGNHSIRDRRFRYIRYANGEEEFYDHSTDPYEWTNLAGNPKFEQQKLALAAQLPEVDAPEVKPARRWDGSELRKNLIEKLDRGETPVQTYNRFYEED